MKIQFYTSSATPCAYVQSPSNLLEISTNFGNPFTTSKPPRDTLPLCLGNFTNQETHCLLINNRLLLSTEEYFSLSFREK